MAAGERAGDGSSGIYLVDKPQGITSHGVVARVRRLAGTRKVGHAGTLDPMATGLLTVGINSSTRLLTYLVGLDKEYFATIRLGQSSSTDDAEGELSPAVGEELLASVTSVAITAAVAEFLGEISQVPSSVSAIKVDGRRSYERVREGETVRLEARSVTVTAFEVLSIRRTEFVDVDVRVECSSGTYIRALARDLGAILGVGGHLTALRRTRIGPFRIGAATKLDDLDPLTDLVAPSTIARELFPVVTLGAQASLDLSHGKRVSIDRADAPCVGAISETGDLVGLIAVSGGIGTTLVNFPARETE